MLPLGMDILTLVGLVDMGIGTLFHIIGLSTIAWSVLDDPLGFTLSSGLFRMCLGDSCFDYDDLASDKVRACQALALIGLMTALAGAALIVFHIMKPRLGRQQNTRIPLLAAIEGSLTCFCVAICAIIWSDVKASEATLGYSCVLSIIGGITVNIGGWIVYITARRTVGYASVP